MLRPCFSAVKFGHKTKVSGPSLELIDLSVVIWHAADPAVMPLWSPSLFAKSTSASTRVKILNPNDDISTLDYLQDSTPLISLLSQLRFGFGRGLRMAAGLMFYGPCTRAEGRGGSLSISVSL